MWIVLTAQDLGESHWGVQWTAPDGGESLISGDF
jgi:hypothetical protein